jgi:hypothetical protein
LPYVFADLTPENRDALLRFCAQYGMPGPYGEGMAWGSWGLGGNSRRPLTVSDLRPGTKEGMEAALREAEREAQEPGYRKMKQKFYKKHQLGRPVTSDIVTWMSFEELRDEVYRFRNFLHLTQILEMEDTSLLIPDPHDRNILAGWYKSYPTTGAGKIRLLEEMLAAATSQLRPRITWDALRHTWVWTWEAATLTSLMYLMVGLDLQGSGSVRMCQGCQRFFLANRASKVYCSPECQNRVHAREYWHANKAARGQAHVQRTRKKRRTRGSGKMKGNPWHL